MIRVKLMNKMWLWRDEKGTVGFVGLENVCVARGRRTVKQLFLTEKFHPRDDDDEFLYGDSELKHSSLSKVPTALVVAPVLVPSPGETLPSGSCALRRVLYSTRPNEI
jgi:hypothetical protein